MKSFILNKLLFWLPMPVIGTLNGLFRGFVLMQFMSEFYAKQISSVILVILLFFYTAFIFGRLGISSLKDSLLTGLLWVMLTISFELLLGYVVLQQDINVMLREYNLLKGNLWLLVLVAIMLLPYSLFRFKIQTHNTSNT
jgi:hypothetical protein